MQLERVRPGGVAVEGEDLDQLALDLATGGFRLGRDGLRVTRGIERPRVRIGSDAPLRPRVARERAREIFFGRCLEAEMGPRAPVARTSSVVTTNVSSVRMSCSSCGRRGLRAPITATS